MNIEYVGRNFQLDESLKKHIAAKLDKLKKFLEDPVEARATLVVEKHRQSAEIHISHRLGVLQATEETDGLMIEAFNLAVEKIDAQARRAREKRVDKMRHGEKNGHPRWPIEVLDRSSLGGGGTPRVVESSHLAIKPMTIEEAALELEHAEPGFIVFRDSSSDRLSVLYRRKDQNYGLITPEL